MCTAISYRAKSHYFGRNLDLERGYGEKVVITPRKYPFYFRFLGEMSEHYAMVGMAAVENDFPLYFEATNEKGLSMAGLNFPQSAEYREYTKGKENIAPFELIPYLLGDCSTLREVKQKLKKMNVIDCDFSEELPVTPLHWMISDKKSSITLECTKQGMRIYENAVEVLTNEPTFDKQIKLLEERIQISGDFSSTSRFQKAVYVKEKSLCEDDESSNVNQFFHILQSVAMPKGCVKTSNGDYQYTRYSCCCNTDTKEYYWNTYDNFKIQSLKMQNIDLESSDLFFTDCY